MSKADKTRQKIIEKAAPLFNKQGYAGTSVQDVMQVTGVSKGCIYGNFADKDAIAIAAFEYNWSFITQQVDAAWQNETTAVGKLMTFANFYRTHYSAVFANGGCPMLNLAVEADDGNSVLRAKAEITMTGTLEKLKSSIQLGIHTGEFGSDTDIEKYAAVLFSLTEGGILLAKTLNQPKLLLHVIDQFEKIIQDELLLKKTQKGGKKRK